MVKNNETPGGEKKDQEIPYAGRWVARVRGRIVAQGGTPDQARLAAQQTRYKDIPEIDYMPLSQPLAFSPLLDTVRTVLPKDTPIYLVGGAVRDALLQKSTHDMDFSLASGGIKVARQVADALRGSFYPLDEERDTGRVILYDPNNIRHVMDFASFRGKDLENDLKARDFTINAMAIDVHSLVSYDPLGGMKDLREKKIRACSPSAFLDDPVRVLRAIRQAASLGYSIVPETRQAMKQAVRSLPNISIERIRDELVKILEGQQPAASIRALDIIGALDFILPELSPLKNIEQPEPHVHNLWEHTLHVLSHLESILNALSLTYDPESASDIFHGQLVLRLGRYRQRFNQHLEISPVPDRSQRATLFLAALYHDISKPSCRYKDEIGKVRFIGHEVEGATVTAKRMERLKFSNTEIERAQAIIGNHMRIHFHTRRLAEEKKSITRRGIYRFFRSAGNNGPDLCLLALADLRATYEETLPQKMWEASLDTCRILLDNWWEKSSESITPLPFIDGDDLIQELNIKAGPEVGYLLERVRETQAAGEIQSRMQALRYARSVKTEVDKGEVREAIRINNVRIVFFQRPGKDIPVVLLHGFPFDHTIWQPILPYLLRDSWIILPDIRGHGQSDAPQGVYAMEGMADDLAAILDYLSARKAILIGHSMGGYIALAYARKYPEHVAGLGLVASRADDDTPENRAARARLIADVSIHGMKAVADAMVPKLTNNVKLRETLRSIIMQTNPNCAVGALQGMADREDSSTLFGSLRIPLLAISGSQDALIAREHVQHMIQLAPNIRHLEIPEAGHMPMMESPEITAKAINQLIIESK